MSDIIVGGRIETFIINGREHPIILINIYDVDELLASKFKHTNSVQEASFGW